MEGTSFIQKNGAEKIMNDSNLKDKIQVNTIVII